MPKYTKGEMHWQKSDFWGNFIKNDFEKNGPP